jgi:hypothetical protein
LEIPEKEKDKARKMFVPLIREMRTKNLPLNHGAGYKIRGVDG